MKLGTLSKLFIVFHAKFKKLTIMKIIKRNKIKNSNKIRIRFKVIYKNKMSKIKN